MFPLISKTFTSTVILFPLISRVSWIVIFILFPLTSIVFPLISNFLASIIIWLPLISRVSWIVIFILFPLTSIIFTLMSIVSTVIKIWLALIISILLLLMSIKSSIFKLPYIFTFPLISTRPVISVFCFTVRFSVVVYLLLIILFLDALFNPPYCLNAIIHKY